MKIMKVGIIAYTLISIFGCCVFGAPDIQTFDDVNTDHKYYEAVEFMRDEKIAIGIGDNLFGVDNPITLYQLEILLSRAFGFDDRYNSEAQNVFAKGWLSPAILSQDPTTKIPLSTTVWSILKAAEIDVYPKYGVNLTTQDYIDVLDSWGICDSNRNPDSDITRGELSQIIYLIKTNQYTEPAMPEVMRLITIVNSDEHNLGEYCGELSKIPVEILKTFESNSWKIVINAGKVNSYYPGANAVTVYNSKEIILKNPGSLVHEFGHFVDYMMSEHSHLDLAGVGIEELDKYNEIYNTNPANNFEFAAEVFTRYINALSSNNTDKMEKLRLAVPKSCILLDWYRNHNWDFSCSFDGFTF